MAAESAKDTNVLSVGLNEISANLNQVLPPTFTLPEVVVQALAANITRYEQDTRASYPNGQNDYGAIALAVNQYYSSQYALAHSGVAWANAHIDVDPALLNDPLAVEMVDTAKATVAALIYELTSKPVARINGAGADDPIAADVEQRLQGVNIRFSAGQSVSGNAGTSTYNADGTTTINIWPSSVSSVFSFLPTQPALVTTLFHELGHAINRSQSQQAVDTFVQSNVPPNGPMTVLQAQQAWIGTPTNVLVEQNATAMGLGLAEFAGPPIGASYSGANIYYGIAPR